MKNDLRSKILAGALLTTTAINALGITAFAEEKGELNLVIEGTKDIDQHKVIEKEEIEKEEKSEEITEKAIIEKSLEEDKDSEKELKKNMDITEEVRGKAAKSSVKYPAKHNIIGTNEVSKEHFKSFLIDMQKKYGYKYNLTVPIDEFLRLAYEEAAAEGVRGDMVVAQSILETGYFKFGGVLTAKDNNFCGLGVTGDGSKLSFSSARIGLRAQVQHLKAYGSKSALNKACVDPRFKYITRGCAPSLEELSGKWAVPGYDRSKYSSLQKAVDAGQSYGQRVYKLITSTKSYKGTPLDKDDNTKPVPPVDDSKIGTGQVINISSRLNIRKGPGTNSEVIGHLTNGQKVNIYGESKGFYKIDFTKNGKKTYGYVSKSYIKKQNESIKPTPPEEPVVPGMKDGKVTGISSKLNVRSGAGTSYKVIGSLRNGDKVKIISESNGFYKINFGTGTGYVSKSYIKVVSSNTPTPSPQPPSEKTGTVKVSSSLNVRKGPGTSYVSIGKLPNGAKVIIVSTSGNWHKIKYKNGFGYVSKSYIK